MSKVQNSCRAHSWVPVFAAVFPSWEWASSIEVSSDGRSQGCRISAVASWPTRFSWGHTATAICRALPPPHHWSHCNLFVILWKHEDISHVISRCTPVPAGTSILHHHPNVHAHCSQSSCTATTKGVFNLSEGANLKISLLNLHQLG